MTTARPPLALTMGEPAGVGGELTLQAWRQLTPDGPVFFALDNRQRLMNIAARLDLQIDIVAIDKPEDAAEVFATALPVIDQPLPIDVPPGQPDPGTVPAVEQSIRQGVALTQAGAAGGIVTNPIQKETMYAAGFKFPGHTEFLGALAGENAHPVMMLASDLLRVIPVTVHQSLASVAATLTTEMIVTAGTIAANDLRASFGIKQPRLAVAGLNPHAGEGGTIGDEEARIITPAVTTLRDAGIETLGPLSADTLFSAAGRARYDVALCMYHDQALIPIKTISFEDAVNVTLGLPFVRTSPDHGTALDIAGTGTADPTSLIAALRMAGDMAHNRSQIAAAA